MKKTLLTAMFAFACLTASAQLPAGATAPDFTATDINGVEHHLYDYLAQGKTVIMDVSATWCGPCWAFHSAHVLEDLAKAYGPEGSDEIVVLFIEGDPATTLANLNGISGPSITQGNWVEGTNYPIIDNAAIADAYDIAYFPTLYRICPDGKVYEMDPALPQTLMPLITTCGPIEGAPDYGEVTLATSTYRICEEGQLTNIAAKLKNYGNNQISSATIVVKENGTVVGTKNFTGAVNQFAAAASATVENVPLHAGSTYTLEIADINGGAVFNDDLATLSFEVVASEESENNIYVEVYTDNYPTEISWELKDASGTTVFQAGPYAGNPNGGGADANTVKNYYLELEGGAECYTLVYKDSYGDGWSLGNGAFKGIKVLNYAGEVVYEEQPGNFGNTFTVNSAFKTDGTMGTSTIANKKHGVYPNPTTGILNFSTTEAVDVTVTDVTGKVVHTAKAIDNGGSINLSSLQKGMYIVQLKGATTQTTEKIIID